MPSAIQGAAMIGPSRSITSMPEAVVMKVRLVGASAAQSTNRRGIRFHVLLASFHSLESGTFDLHHTR